MQFISRTGRFIGTPIKWTWWEGLWSPSFNLRIWFAIDTEIGNEGGESPLDCPLEAVGTFKLIRGNGKVNDTIVLMLCSALGWNGSIISLEAGHWAPNRCRLTVDLQTYRGKSNYCVTSVEPLPVAQVETQPQ